MGRDHLPGWEEKTSSSGSRSFVSSSLLPGSCTKSAACRISPTCRWKSSGIGISSSFPSIPFLFRPAGSAFADWRYRTASSFVSRLPKILRYSSLSVIFQSRCQFFSSARRGRYLCLLHAKSADARSTSLARVRPVLGVAGWARTRGLAAGA